MPSIKTWNVSTNNGCVRIKNASGVTVNLINPFQVQVEYKGSSESTWKTLAMNAYARVDILSIINVRVKDGGGVVITMPVGVLANSGCDFFVPIP